MHIPHDAVPPAALFYDRELAARVARLYAEDFRRYGYSSNLLQLATSDNAHGAAAPVPPGATLTPGGIPGTDRRMSG